MKGPFGTTYSPASAAAFNEAVPNTKTKNSFTKKWLALYFYFSQKILKPQLYLFPREGTKGKYA